MDKHSIQGVVGGGGSVAAILNAKETGIVPVGCYTSGQSCFLLSSQSKNPSVLK